jgi:hypothetical protein
MDSDRTMESHVALINCTEGVPLISPRCLLVFRRFSRSHYSGVGEASKLHCESHHRCGKELKNMGTETQYKFVTNSVVTQHISTLKVIKSDIGWEFYVK